MQGIYGEGEERHLPRVVKMLQMGLIRFVVGATNSLVEFVYVDNLVQAHMRAAQAMQRCSGRAYFISDGEPINNFVFFRPLIEGLGYTYPTLRIPYALAMRTAHLIEIVHRYFCVDSLLWSTEVSYLQTIVHVVIGW